MRLPIASFFEKTGGGFNRFLGDSLVFSHAVSKRVRDGTGMNSPSTRLPTVTAGEHLIG